MYYFECILSIQIYLFTLFSCFALDQKGNQTEFINPVVVVGGGLAGIAATLEAISRNVPVILIEGEKKLGGNSARATAGINGCESYIQRRYKVRDSSNQYFADVLTGGDDDGDAELIDVMAEEATKAINWLSHNGVAFDSILKNTGHTFPRTHRFSSKRGRFILAGAEIISRLQERLKKEKIAGKNFKIMMGSKVTSLIVEVIRRVNTVVGVRYSYIDEKGVSIEREIRSHAVILATGGFANAHMDENLMKRYAPDRQQLPTTNGNFATGSGITITMRAGLAPSLLDMPRIQLHPTGFVDLKYPSAIVKTLAPEAFRIAGALLVNQEGRRFCNELGRRQYIYESMINHGTYNMSVRGQTVYLILSDATVDRLGWPEFNYYWKTKQLVEKFQNYNQFCRKFGVNNATLRTNLEMYNTLANLTKPEQKENEDDFGKGEFPTPISPTKPLYAAQVTPVAHYTIGGLEISRDSEVMSSYHQKIPGLYAAGEVTGGIHGIDRLFGNSLTECVIFGRIAGRAAAQRYKLLTPPPVSSQATPAKMEL